jgi:hypothetical protein
MLIIVGEEGLLSQVLGKMMMKTLDYTYYI